MRRFVTYIGSAVTGQCAAILICVCTNLPMPVNPVQVGRGRGRAGSRPRKS
jgi:hypothetical protein